MPQENGEAALWFVHPLVSANLARRELVVRFTCDLQGARIGMKVPRNIA